MPKESAAGRRRASAAAGCCWRGRPRGPGPGKMDSIVGQSGDWPITSMGALPPSPQTRGRRPHSPRSTPIERNPPRAPNGRTDKAFLSRTTKRRNEPRRFAQLAGLRPLGFARLSRAIARATLFVPHGATEVRRRATNHASPSGALLSASLQSGCHAFLQALTTRFARGEAGPRCFMGEAKRADGGLSSSSTDEQTNDGLSQGLRWI